MEKKPMTKKRIARICALFAGIIVADCLAVCAAIWVVRTTCDIVQDIFNPSNYEKVDLNEWAEGVVDDIVNVKKEPEETVVEP